VITTVFQRRVRKNGGDQETQPIRPGRRPPPPQQPASQGGHELCDDPIEPAAKKVVIMKPAPARSAAPASRAGHADHD
jgi:hypothetical protein